MKRQPARGAMPQRQRGYVLIFMVLAMLGIGGVVLAGFTQQIKQDAELERLAHNKRVLAEAKQALLQFAYNYPQYNRRGPGRLPCPDANNDGLPNDDCDEVGRFPWSDPRMDFYDARDASNERLWYAVSETFHNQVTSTVNSDSLGTITIHDQSRELMYDGSAAGIAAVIIAPGPEIERAGVAQNRTADNGDNRFDQIADSHAGIVDPINYLDIVAGLDNADFTNDSAADGFVLGPIEDPATRTILVNDQVAIVTAAELVEMAEKATLQAYRNAVVAYDELIDSSAAGAGDYYPWLFNYNVDDLNDYPADSDFPTELLNSLDNRGRIPSIFSEYFTDSNSQPIDTRLRVQLTLRYPLAPSTVGYTFGTAEFDSASDIVFDVISTNLVSDLKFDDLGAAEDGPARLSANFTSDDSHSLDPRYFWDDYAAPDGWSECPVVVGNVNDCNRDAAGNLVPGAPDNQTPSQILEVTPTINLHNLVHFDTDYTDYLDNPLPKTVVNPADASQHANISATFNGTDLNAATLPVELNYRYDSNYNTVFIGWFTGRLDLDDLLQGGSLTLSMRFYPELPNWAQTNNWHNSIMMAYADGYRPGAGGTCTPGTDCLQLNNFAGIEDNKISVITLGGQHDWNDTAPAGFVDDIGDIFEAENANNDAVFDAAPAGGNDRILVVCDRVGGASRCY